MKTLPFLLMLVLLASCANRNATGKASTASAPPASPSTEEEPPAPPEAKQPEPTMSFSDGFWRQSALSDAPDLEYAVDPESVESVWYLRADAFGAMLDGEPVDFDIPGPGTATKMFRVEDGSSGAGYRITSLDGSCSGKVTGNAKAFRFEMKCNGKGYILEPLLEGSAYFYAFRWL